MTTNSRTTTRRARLARMALAALCVAPSCADVDETVDTQPAQDSATVAALGADGTIRGTDFTRFRLVGSPIRLQAVDLGSTAIEAQVERGDGFEVHPGAGKADGTFEIHGVPRGREYWLRVGTNWFLTRERTVDVGGDALGRPDAVGAAAGTSLVFDADGLVPFTSGDDFQLEAPGAQIGFYSTASSLNPITANAPAPGDTSLAGALFPFDADAAAGTSQFDLIQASQGDTLTLAQLTTRQVGAITYQALSRALTTSVEMTQGAATAVHGTMTAPPSVTTALDYRQADFEALAEGIRPGSVPAGTSALIDASPGGQRVNLGTPDLAIVPLAANGGNQVLPIEYGNPYPRSWPLFAVISTFFQVPFTGIDADGSPTPRHISSTVLSWEFIEGRKVTVAPVVSSVRDLSVDGEPACDRIQAASATPVVSWRRPRHGRPSGYIVRIVHVIPNAPFAQGGIGRLLVDGDTHRVRVPAGVLQPGEHYYFQVIAVASSQPRARGELNILFVPPRAQVVDAFSSTIRVEDAAR